MSHRLLAAFVLVTAVVLAVLIVPLGLARQDSEKADLTRRVEHDAVTVAAIAVDPLRSRSSDPAALREYLERYTERTGARVVVVDATGAAVVDTDVPEGREDERQRDFSSRPEIRLALAGDVASGERDSATLGYRLLYVAVPVSSGGQALGAVRVSYPTEELDERVHRYWYGLAAIALAVLAFASIIGALTARWLTRPLERLASTAAAMGEGDFAVRADDSAGPPEVRALAARFNESVDALEHLITEQREFVADASHQLRTPLHALRLRLENAQADAAAGRSEHTEAALQRAVDEVDRLAALVTALLVLERADKGAATPVEEVALDELLARRASAWSDLGGRRGVEVTVSVLPGTRACAREVHVEQVLDNLVDNAIGVTPRGERVEVVARAREDRVVVHVVDRGPGMTDEQIDSAFRRFSRGSQSASAPQSGFGLGLAIVRRLTELDGGSVALRHAPHGGIDAVIEYPSPRS